jgi:hypothetical protein
MIDPKNYKNNRLMDRMFDSLTDTERKTAHDLEMTALKMAEKTIKQMDRVSIDIWNAMSEEQKEDLDIVQFSMEAIHNLIPDDGDYMVYGKAILLTQFIMEQRLEDLNKAAQGNFFKSGSDIGKLFVEFMKNSAVFLAVKNIEEEIKNGKQPKQPGV